MLKIRLQRVGRVHEPRFRVVLTDSKNSTKSGRFKEVLGSYDARKDEDNLKADRINHWLSLGASPTDTVHNLLVKHKVIDAPKVNLKVPLKAPAPVAEAEAPAPEAEAPTEAAPAESAPATEAPAAEAPAEEVAPAPAPEVAVAPAPATEEKAPEEKPAE